MGLEDGSFDESQVLDQLDKNLDQNEDADQAPDFADVNKSELSPSEVKSVERGEKSIPDIIAERNQHAAEGDAILAQFNREGIIDNAEQQEIMKRMEGIKSAEKMNLLLEELRDLPKQKEAKQAQDLEDAKEVPFEHPKLQEELKKGLALIRKHKAELGTKAAAEYEKWLTDEVKQKPSVLNARETIEKMATHSKEGIEKRVQFYKGELLPFLKANKVDISKSPFCQREGFSEKKKYLENAKQYQTQLDQQKNLGLLSDKAREREMQKMLTVDNNAPNPTFAAQERMLTEQRKTQEAEAANLVKIKSAKATIPGPPSRTINAMSEASIKQLLEYQADQEIGSKINTPNGSKTRAEMAAEWPKMAEAEGKLFTKLGEILKDHPDLLESAAKPFAGADYMTKESIIKEYEKAAKSQEGKEKLRETVIVGNFKAQTSKAKSENIFSKKTAERWDKWISDPKSYNNDIKTLEQYYKTFTSPTPVNQGDARNIAAYKVERDKFTDSIKKLADADPTMTEEDLKKKQSEYDNESFKKRLKLHDSLKQEIDKAKVEKRAESAKSNELNITDSDKLEMRERSPEKSEVMQAVTLLLVEGKPLEAERQLHLYIFSDPEKVAERQSDPEIARLQLMVAQAKLDHVRQAQLEATMEQRIQEEVDKRMSSDSFKDRVREANLAGLNLDEAKKAKEQSGQTDSGRDRARKESLDATTSQEEHDLTESFYNQASEDTLLNNDKTGEDITTIKISDVDATKEELHEMTEATRQNEDRINKNQGLNNVQFVREDGKTGQLEEMIKQQKEQETKLTAEIAQEAADADAKKQETQAGNVVDYSDFAQRIAQRRLDRQKNEKEYLRNAG